jgi:hypothetical protein
MSSAVIDPSGPESGVTVTSVGSELASGSRHEEDDGDADDGAVEALGFEEQPQDAASSPMAMEANANLEILVMSSPPWASGIVPDGGQKEYRPDPADRKAGPPSR